MQRDQREFIERAIPAICQRGGWTLRTAAARADHVRVICDAPREIHGERVQKWMKRWLTEALDAEWPDPARPRWWAKAVSNKAIKEDAYLRNAVEYVQRQRTTQT